MSSDKKSPLISPCPDQLLADQHLFALTARGVCVVDEVVEEVVDDEVEVPTHEPHVELVAQALLPPPGKIHEVKVAVEAHVLPEGVTQAVVRVGRSVGCVKEVVELVVVVVLELLVLLLLVLVLLLLVVVVVVDDPEVSGVSSEIVIVEVGTDDPISHPEIVETVVVVVAVAEHPVTTDVEYVVQEEDPVTAPPDGEDVTQDTKKSVTVALVQDATVVVAESETEQPTMGSQVDAVLVVEGPTEDVVAQRDAVSVSHWSGSDEYVGLWSGPML